MQDIMSDFGETYKEISVSGNGVHIFSKGRIHKNINNQADRFEMYKSNKCIAMTGDVIGNCAEVQNEQYKLNLYYEKYALKETIRERISYYKNLDSDVPDIEDILKAIYMTNRKGRELFRGKNQQRFTRAKTIGANYNEERIKNRILNKDKELGNIIDIKNSEKAKSSKGYENWATKHNLKTAASTLVEIRNKGFNSMEELERDISRISIEKNDLKREFDKLSLEQKRIKEVVKHIQICISKREHYEGYRKNPNDKIYMIMNRKDVEAYQKSYEEIGIFLKQFPHLRHVVLGELKTKSGKNLFKKLNEHSKELQAKQEEIIKEYNSLAVQYDELEHLKNNMNEYLGRDKVEKKKESIIDSVKSRKTEDKEMPEEKKEIRKEFER